jgi:hypothetical protein
MIKVKDVKLKEEICDALEGKHKVKCPKCKSEKFIKTCREIVEIKVAPDIIEDDYIAEIINEYYECARCCRELREEEMI